jgi:hypothetical protein
MTMNTLFAENMGDFTNVYVGLYRDQCFTIHHHYRVWGTAPEDSRPEWELLCDMAGLDPDDAEATLNEAANLPEQSQ